MNDFLSGLFSVALLFAVSFVTSFVILAVFGGKIIPRRPARPKKRVPKESIYYLATEEQPKRKTVAIKGTLLTQSELDKLMGKDEK